MTYNFDADAWHERELAALQLRLQRGEISAELHASLCDQAARQYERMQETLEGTLQYK